MPVGTVAAGHAVQRVLSCCCLSGLQDVVCRGKHNKSAGSFAVLRGQYAPQVDVSCLKDAALYPAWLHDPVVVAATSRRFRKYEMTSTMISADQVRGHCSLPCLTLLLQPASRFLHSDHPASDMCCLSERTALGCSPK